MTNEEIRHRIRISKGKDKGLDYRTRELASIGLPPEAGWLMASKDDWADRAIYAERKLSALIDGQEESLKRAFVAGCCAVLTWTHSGMPQDDLDEAGYDYAATVMREDAK